MFDLGNGSWVAPEFIVSVTKHKDPDNGWEWVTLWTAGGHSWNLDFEDQTIITPYTTGIKTLGYASVDDFCAALLAAIKEAKK